ncbi:hypothetical protein TWF694_002007 [Orbilia ellipsospora]|uniref:F-box domain-containing protein n=1 Tax=Orbilia ellipsospora TaxID=2528407 RepID=A0AAV9X4I8_9PEZI
MKKFLQAVTGRLQPAPCAAAAQPVPPRNAIAPLAAHLKNPTSDNATSTPATPESDEYSYEEYIHPPPPNGNPLPHLPVELHYQILEFAHWTDHPSLAKVCRSWRHFLTHSPTILDNRYETYNRFYDEPFKLPAYTDIPKPRLHRVIEHLEVFVRNKDGILRPGRIHLFQKRDRWGGHWEYFNNSNLNTKPGFINVSQRKWIKPRCKFLEPFDYSLFKNDPILIHAGGSGGEKVAIKSIETSYRIEDTFSVFGSYFKFDETMTVGDYINEMMRGVNLEKGLPIGVGGPGRSDWDENNVIWLSVYASLQLLKYILEVRFVVTALKYDVEK